MTLKRLRVQFGLTIEMFCRKADIDKPAKLFRGDRCTSDHFRSGKSLFDYEPPQLLHPDELLGRRRSGTSPNSKQVQEWKVEAYLTAWERTANGLQYQVARLRHRLLPDRFARQML